MATIKEEPGQLFLKLEPPETTEYNSLNLQEQPRTFLIINNQLFTSDLNYNSTPHTYYVSENTAKSALNHVSLPSTTAYLKQEATETETHEPLQILHFEAVEVNAAGGNIHVDESLESEVISADIEEPSPTVDPLVQQNAIQKTSQISKKKTGGRECDICGKVLCNRESVRRHKKFIHKVDENGFPVKVEPNIIPPEQKKAKLRECQICNKVLCNKDSLRRHLKSLHNVEEVPEDAACNTQFQQQIPNDVKVLEQIPPIETREVYFQENDLVLQQNHNDVGENQAKKTMNQAECDICKKSYYNKYTLQQHMRTMHSNSSNPGSLTPIPNNMKMNHKSMINQINCGICDQSFVDMSTLRSHHVMIHQIESPTLNGTPSSSSEKSPKSNLSETSSSSSSSTKSSRKSQNCHICNKTLYDKSVLGRHLKNIHGIERDRDLITPHKKSSTSPKSQQCHICNKVLYDKGVLRRHLKNIHHIDGDVASLIVGMNKSDKSRRQSDEAARPKIDRVRQNSSKAKECPPTPPLIQGLSPEAKVLSPNKCGVCDETFSNPSNLRRHQVLVHHMKVDNYEAVMRKYKAYSVDPHPCGICGKVIVGRSNLSRHQKKIHKIEFPNKELTSPASHVSGSSNSNHDSTNGTDGLESNNSLEPKNEINYEAEMAESYSNEFEQNSYPYSVIMHTSMVMDQKMDTSELNHLNEFGEVGESVFGISGIGEIFELNEVEEIVAEVKQEGETQVDDNNMD